MFKKKNIIDSIKNSFDGIHSYVTERGSLPRFSMKSRMSQVHLKIR